MGRSEIHFIGAMAFGVGLTFGLMLIAHHGFDETTAAWVQAIGSILAIIASAAIAVLVPRMSERRENLRLADKAYTLAIMLKAAVQSRAVLARVVSHDEGKEDEHYQSANRRLNLTVIAESFRSFPAERLPVKPMHHFLLLAGVAANCADFMARRDENPLVATFLDGELALFAAMIEEHTEALADLL